MGIESKEELDREAGAAQFSIEGKENAEKTLRAMNADLEALKEKYPNLTICVLGAASFKDGENTGELTSVTMQGSVKLVGQAINSLCFRSPEFAAAIEGTKLPTLMRLLDLGEKLPGFSKDDTPCQCPNCVARRKAAN